MHWVQPRGLLDVVLTPLLYPEDEAEMRRHVDTLQIIARFHPTLTPIVEFSIHENKVRSRALLPPLPHRAPSLTASTSPAQNKHTQEYTPVGYIAADTRFGFSVMERNEGPMLSDYLLRLPEVYTALVPT